MQNLAQVMLHLGGPFGYAVVVVRGRGDHMRVLDRSRADDGFGRKPGRQVAVRTLSTPRPIDPALTF